MARNFSRSASRRFADDLEDLDMPTADEFDGIDADEDEDEDEAKFDSAVAASARRAKRRMADDAILDDPDAILGEDEELAPVVASKRRAFKSRSRRSDDDEAILADDEVCQAEDEAAPEVEVTASIKRKVARNLNKLADKIDAIKRPLNAKQRAFVAKQLTAASDILDAVEEVPAAPVAEDECEGEECEVTASIKRKVARNLNKLADKIDAIKQPLSPRQRAFVAKQLNAASDILDAADEKEDPSESNTLAQNIKAIYDSKSSLKPSDKVGETFPWFNFGLFKTMKLKDFFINMVNGSPSIKK